MHIQGAGTGLKEESVKHMGLFHWIFESQFTYLVKAWNTRTRNITHK